MTEPAGAAASEGDLNTSPLREDWRRELGQEARNILGADDRVFFHQSLSTPCLDVLAGAAGATITDLDGRTFLDFHGNSVHQIGYGHPRVVAAIKAQLDALPFSPRRYTNRPAIALAERLVALAPAGLGKVLLAPSGAAAVSMALKLARAATGRSGTLSMWDSFHGANLDTISVGGEALFRAGAGALLAGTEHVPPLDQAERLFGGDGRGAERLADYIDYALASHGDVAALIAEPMRWTTVFPPPPDFWPRVKQACRRHGALLIFDEIPSCLGRTGTMFASEQVGASPDILVIGKGLGGGIMPMAAIIARADLDIAPDGALGHYTHEKSPVGSAAALATLDVIAEDGLVARAEALGRQGLDRLKELVARQPLFREARGLGLYFGLELAGSDAIARPAADRMLYACLRRGLSFKLGAGRVITLCPPLTISQAELAKAFAIVEAAGDEIAAG